MYDFKGKAINCTTWEQVEHVCEIAGLQGIKIDVSRNRDMKCLKLARSNDNRLVNLSTWYCSRHVPMVEYADFITPALDFTGKAIRCTSWQQMLRLAELAEEQGYKDQDLLNKSDFFDGRVWFYANKENMSCCNLFSYGVEVTFDQFHTV